MTMADDSDKTDNDRDHGDETGQDDEARVIDGGSPSQMAGSP